jgi:hypothetical protein
MISGAMVVNCVRRPLQTAIRDVTLMGVSLFVFNKLIGNHLLLSLVSRPTNLVVSLPYLCY